jgi:hypothetical protein
MKDRRTIAITQDAESYARQFGDVPAEDVCEHCASCGALIASRVLDVEPHRDGCPKTEEPQCKTA